jgi:mRNA deadenylase 3'-5' endonuclease subunit Ccr4
MQKSLADTLTTFKPDVLSLKETKFTKRLHISGYNLIQTQRRRNGGVVCVTTVRESKQIKALNSSITWMCILYKDVQNHLLSVIVDPWSPDTSNEDNHRTRRDCALALHQIRQALPNHNGGL